MKYIEESEMTVLTMSKGTQAKYFDDKENVWYKQDYLGTEGLSEYVASQLLDLHGQSLPFTKYEPCKFMNGKNSVIGCKSDNFLLPGERLVTAYELFQKEMDIDIADEIVHMDVEDKISYFVENIKTITGIDDFGQYLTQMLQLDAVTKNDDRHFNNISFVVDQDNNYRVAPIYDNGGSFLADKYSYGYNLSYDDVLNECEHVLAKPFSMNFDEQLDACEKLYPATISLKKDVFKSLDKEMLAQYYSEDDIRKAETIVNQAQRKYQYLFAEELNKEVDL